MPQPQPVEELGDRIVSVYRIAWQQVVEEQQAIAADPAKFRRRAQLAEVRSSIESLMDTVDDQARQWLTADFPGAYGLGAVTGAHTAGEVFAWAQPHIDAVAELANDLFGDLLQGTDGVRASTKTVLRQLAREQSVSAVVGSRTATEAGETMARLAEGRGIWAVRYKDGSLHGLDDYADMAIRTKTATAYNYGTVKGSGVEWFEVGDGASCGWLSHDDTDLANGKIVTAEEALNNPLSHPRCRRALFPRPDIASKAEAARATPLTTPEQRADQAAAEDARAARIAARAARTAHDRRLAARAERQGQRRT